MSLVNFGDCECNIVKAVLFYLQSAGKEVVYAALGLDTPMGDHKVGGGVWRDALLRFRFGSSSQFPLYTVNRHKISHLSKRNLFN